MIIQAFLLSYTKYGDHDVVLHCFSWDNGYESFFVRGIYTKSNKKKAFLFPLNELLLNVAEKNKGIKNVLKIEQKNPDSFSNDIRKNTILFYISDFLNHNLRNEQKNEKVYSEIAFFLEELRLDNFQSHLVLMYQVLKHHGLQPLLSEKKYLNPESGQFDSSETHHFFDEEVSTIWKNLITSEKPYTLRFNRHQKQKMMDSLLVYYHFHVSDFRTPKSLEIIKELF